MTYETFIGLWLNVPRIRYERAAMILAGTQAAGNNEQLDAIYGDALARFPSEIGDVMYEINAARAVAKSMTRRGM